MRKWAKLPVLMKQSIASLFVSVNHLTVHHQLTSLLPTIPWAFYDCLYSGSVYTGTVMEGPFTHYSLGLGLRSAWLGLRAAWCSFICCLDKT